jgi:arginine kinase
MTASTAFLGTLDCTRNLLDYELPKSLNVNQLETVERLVTTVLLSDDVARALYPNASEDDLAEGCGVYYTMNEVLEDPSEARVVLASNGLLIPLWNIPESDRLHGKHWPYGRGVFISNGSNLAVWINVSGSRQDCNLYSSHKTRKCRTDLLESSSFGVSFAKALGI